MKKMVYWAAGCLFLFACQNNPADKTTVINDSTAQAKAASNPPPIEFADSSYILIGQKALADFAKADYEALMSVYTDDSRLLLANGDSVKGKANIEKYWKGTMAIADSIRFINPVYLSLKVNESKQVLTGNYLLIWYDFNFYLKKGKKLSGRAHDVVHITPDKKTDVILHYADNAPIMIKMKK